MDCIDLTSKQSEMLSYVVKHSKLRKTTKVFKLQWIASIWHQNDLKCWDTSQNYKSDQITMNCIDLTSKQSEMLSYVVKHSKLRKITKVIKLQWIASIWHSKRSKMLRYFSKLQSDQTIMNCIDLTSKRSKLFSYVAKHTKVIKLQWIASIWHQNDLKCWDCPRTTKVIKQMTMNFIDLCQNDQNYKSTRSNYNEFASIWRQNDQNNAKLQTRSNYDEFASIWRQNYQKCWGKCKTFKTTQNYKVKKLQWIASIWCQNDQKTQNYKMNQITINLHRFDVKSIKNVEVRRKTFNTTQNYESDQIIMNCIDLTSKRSKLLS